MCFGSGSRPRYDVSTPINGKTGHKGEAPRLVTWGPFLWTVLLPRVVSRVAPENGRLCRVCIGSRSSCTCRRYHVGDHRAISCSSSLPDIASCILYEPHGIRRICTDSCGIRSCRARPRVRASYNNSTTTRIDFMTSRSGGRVAPARRRRLISHPPKRKTPRS